MKTLIQKTMHFGIIFIFFFGIGIANAQNGTDSFVTVSGQLKDAKTGEKIIYATISVPGSGVGTVSNSEGEFLLKVSKSLNAEVFEVSHLSYSTTKFKISESIGKDKTFYLEPQYLMLKQITVVPKDARGIVSMALRNIRKNYSEVPNMMTGFYRETIRQRRDYISNCWGTFCCQ